MATDSPKPVTGPTWTDEQSRAIGARGLSVALSAGAGCGKTFVLTQRFLSELRPEQGVAKGRNRLGQLVAITFTDRAAREMRERIRQACRRRLREASPEQADYWLALSRELDAARIETIHSFCGSLLRGHAVEAGLDPRFRVLDQAGAQTLLFESLDERLRERLADRDEAVIDLVVLYGLDGLYEMVRTLLGRRQEIDWAAWRDETPESLAARWEDFWQTDTLPRALRQVADSPAVREVLELARTNSPSNNIMRQRCEELSERLPELQRFCCEVVGCHAHACRGHDENAKQPPHVHDKRGHGTRTADDPQQTPLQNHDPAAMLAAIRDCARVQGGGGKKAWESKEAYERFSQAAKKLRETIDKTKRFLTFDAEAARPAAETALRLLALTADVDADYQRKKDEAASLDFDDMLIHARRLLVGPERRDLRRRIASQIGLLLVDEFQDTDPLQVELVAALCDEELTGGRLFFVGDLKQSIYRFRGADPRVFRQLRGQIAPEGRLPLSLNFRSQPAVLDFVNGLFCDELAEDDAAGPRYEALRAHRPQVGPTPAVEFLWAIDDEPGPKAGQKDRQRRLEADWIARRLRAMLDDGEKVVFDAEAAKAGSPTVRAVRPGDVTLLFRALSNVDLYEEALRRYGIDYYLVGGRAFYAQQEIFDLLNLLRAVASPSDEVSLIGALRSPLFGLIDETLVWLARHPDGIWAGLVTETPPAELTPPQRERVRRAAETFRILRAKKDRVPTAELIREAMTRTGYDAILLAEFLGQRKLANLNKLIEQTRSFDRSGLFTLSDFITQLAEFVARQPGEPLAATHPESTDVVRLMTVHQSKGLEFPVVVVPDLNRAKHNQTASVAFARLLGPMVRDPDPDRKALVGLDLHALAEGDEDLAESARLLYVATTRAADYLILSAGLPSLDKSKGPWLDLISRRYDLATGRFLGDHRPKDATEGATAGLSSSAGGESKRGTAGQASSGTQKTEGEMGNDLSVRVTMAEPPLSVRPAGKATRLRLDQLIDQTRRAAKRGEVRVPQFLDAVHVDRGARQQYSFSRLNGSLVHAHQGDDSDDRFGATVGLPGGDCMGLPRHTAGQASSGTQDEQPSVDPLGLGTLVHAVLAEMDFGRPGDVETMVRRHAARHLSDADAPLDEPIDLIRRFVASRRAAQMAEADELHAEIEFLLPWPPEDTDGEPDGRHVQGFIDCLYRDVDGGWHLVDYKTNRVSAETMADVAAGYEMQMLLYALATERILGVPPVELALCFLRPGLEHRFAWDAAARQRVRDLVDRAIAGHNG